METLNSDSIWNKNPNKRKGSKLLHKSLQSDIQTFCTLTLPKKEVGWPVKCKSVSKATAQSGKKEEMASSTCVAQWYGCITKVLFSFFSLQSWTFNTIWEMNDFHHLTLWARVLTPENPDSLLRPPDPAFTHKVWTPASFSSVHGGRGGGAAGLSSLGCLLTSSKGLVMLVSNCQSSVLHTFRLRSSAWEAMYLPTGSQVNPFTKPEWPLRVARISVEEKKRLEKH